MEALWATILFSGFALEVIIRQRKFYDFAVIKIQSIIYIINLIFKSIKKTEFEYQAD